MYIFTYAVCVCIHVWLCMCLIHSMGCRAPVQGSLLWTRCSEPGLWEHVQLLFSVSHAFTLILSRAPLLVNAAMKKLTRTCVRVIRPWEKECAYVSACYFACVCMCGCVYRWQIVVSTPTCVVSCCCGHVSLNCGTKYKCVNVWCTSC